MVFTFDLTEREYIEYASFAMKETEAFRKKLIQTRLMFTSIPALLGLMIVFITGKKDFRFAVGVLFLTTAAFIIFPKIFNMLFENKLLKLLHEKGSNLIGKRTISFKNSSIIEKTAGGDNVTNYKRITGVKCSEKAIYLFNPPISTIIVPFRVFSSEEEKQEFMNFIKSKFPDMKI